MAGLLYLTVALIPLLLGMIAAQLLPAERNGLIALVYQKTGVVVQIFFFGALLSAIMSTASGALLAPSAIFSENILKKYWAKDINDKKMLHLSRISVLIMAAVSLIFALLKKDIYELVAEASALSLVSLFVPLVAGLFLKSTNQATAMASMIAGLISWLIAMNFLPEAVPAIFYGLGASILVYLVVDIGGRLWAAPPR